MDKLTSRNKDIYFTPIFVPGETYRFIINGELITDPAFDSFRLRLYNNAGQMVSNDFGVLSRMFPLEDIFLVSPPRVNPYIIYCTMVFPQVPLGQYYFTVHDESKDAELVRSNVIICETHLMTKSVLVEYRNDRGIYNYYYDNKGLPADFYNTFRLPLTQEELQYESDRKQYRNATNQQFRNLRSNRYTMRKIRGILLDDDGHEALSAMLEHSDIIVDGKPVTVKTALQIEANNSSELTSSSFDAYFDNEDIDEDELRFWGPVIFCGDHIFNPTIVYDANT